MPGDSGRETRSSNRGPTTSNIWSDWDIRVHEDIVTFACSKKLNFDVLEALIAEIVYLDTALRSMYVNRDTP